MSEVAERPNIGGAEAPADSLAGQGRPAATEPSGSIVAVTASSRQLKSAALLVIAAGIVSLANGLVAILAGGEVYDVDLTIPVGTYCGAIVILLGIGGILSGIVAVHTRRLSPALAGAIMGIAGGGLVGFWLGIAAVVLLTLSHEDF